MKMKIYIFSLYLFLDVSIWLMSFENMRDEGGRISPNAYLLGLYHRLCKLLYYKIKPIFVFDGATPEIKKQTLVNKKIFTFKYNFSFFSKFRKIEDKQDNKDNLYHIKN